MPCNIQRHLCNCRSCMTAVPSTTLDARAGMQLHHPTCSIWMMPNMRQPQRKITGYKLTSATDRCTAGLAADPAMVSRSAPAASSCLTAGPSLRSRVVSSHCATCVAVYESAKHPAACPSNIDARAIGVLARQAVKATKHAHSSCIAAQHWRPLPQHLRLGGWRGRPPESSGSCRPLRQRPPVTARHTSQPCTHRHSEVSLRAQLGTSMSNAPDSATCKAEPMQGKF